MTDEQQQDQAEVEDLEPRDETAEVKGGAMGDPDEGGQVAYKPPARNRLASNANENLADESDQVEDLEPRDETDAVKGGVMDEGGQATDSGGAYKPPARTRLAGNANENLADAPDEIEDLEPRDETEAVKGGDQVHDQTPAKEKITIRPERHEIS